MDMPPVDVVALLNKVAAAPYIIEAPDAPTDVREGVIRSLAARAPGRTAEMTAKNSAEIEAYRGTIGAIKEQLKAELPENPNYTIEFVDLAGNAKAEADRLAKLTSQDKMARRYVKDGFEQGGIALGLDRKKGGRICMVSPFAPRVNIDDVLNKLTGVDANRDGVSDQDFHRQVAWHEVGHCLVGGSEMKADIFAALMTIRDTPKPGMLLRWAMWRESAELQAREIDDNHDVSKGIWQIVRMEDKLRADPEFMSMSVDGIAALANQVAQKADFTVDEKLAIRDIRVMIAVAISKKAHFIAEPGGGLKPTDLAGWLHASGLAPVERLTKLTRAIMDGSDPGDPPQLDRKALREAIATLAKRGDPTAIAIGRAIDIEAPVSARSLKREYVAQMKDDAKIPLQFSASRVVSDRVLRWAMDTQQISFSADQSSYMIKDQQTGRVVQAGKVELSGGQADVSLEGRWKREQAPVAPNVSAELEHR